MPGFTAECSVQPPTSKHHQQYGTGNAGINNAYAVSAVHPMSMGTEYIGMEFPAKHETEFLSGSLASTPSLGYPPFPPSPMRPRVPSIGLSDEDLLSPLPLPPPRLPKPKKPPKLPGGCATGYVRLPGYPPVIPQCGWKLHCYPIKAGEQCCKFSADPAHDYDDKQCGGTCRDCTELGATCELGRCLDNHDCEVPKEIYCPDLGKCVIRSPGHKVCNNKCVDVLNDDYNCGDCGIVCPVLSQGQTHCYDGTCKYCPTNLTRCNYNCVDVKSDRDNCGRCNNPCKPEEYCDNGTCKPCPSGQTPICRGFCEDIDKSSCCTLDIPGGPYQATWKCSTGKGKPACHYAVQSNGMPGALINCYIMPW